jgi:hypothetical protein
MRAPDGASNAAHIPAMPPPMISRSAGAAVLRPANGRASTSAGRTRGTA